ncbi:hypothetical protein I3842_05G093400 [Carya illinoinensis]|uniref:Uncharacterized protein n=1 Tax=Carya illinoinensis TaxID=32201 RepID=A0A922JPC7_CARIL|nr:hypothetical protein I3842_05G093400 [Carya illinoinensis]
MPNHQSCLLRLYKQTEPIICLSLYNGLLLQVLASFFFSVFVLDFLIISAILFFFQFS